MPESPVRSRKRRRFTQYTVVHVRVTVEARGTIRQGYPEALALTEQRMRGECDDVVVLTEGVSLLLDPTAPHGPYHVLTQRFRVGG